MIPWEEASFTNLAISQDSNHTMVEISKPCLTACHFEATCRSFASYSQNICNNRNVVTHIGYKKKRLTSSILAPQHLVVTRKAMNSHILSQLVDGKATMNLNLPLPWFTIQKLLTLMHASGVFTRQQSQGSDASAGNDALHCSGNQARL
jgi:hypothetical protein